MGEVKQRDIPETLWRADVEHQLECPRRAIRADDVDPVRTSRANQDRFRRADTGTFQDTRRIVFTWRQGTEVSDAPGVRVRRLPDLATGDRLAICADRSLNCL